MAPSIQDELVLLPLGGAGEIGMNFNAYGYGPPNDREWIIVDCGVLFGKEGPNPGIDLIMPDIRYLAELKENIRGIVLTHAHEDHIGAVPYLWPELECPVYATPFTARLLEDKLYEAGLQDRLKLKIVPLGGSLKLGPFDIEFMSITHSIPEPNALAITTPLGTVVHTGDWKLDPDPLLGEATDGDAFRQLGDKGVLAMVCDSTNALVPGESGSEARVEQSLDELIGTLKGRVAVTSFASNAARLGSIARAAKKHGRQVALVGRAMHRIVGAARETGYLTDLPAMLDEEEAAQLPASRVLYLCTGSQGEPRAALSRIASGDHPEQACGTGRRSAHRARSFRARLRPSRTRRAGADVSLGETPHRRAGAWRDPSHDRACAACALAAGAGSRRHRQRADAEARAGPSRDHRRDTVRPPLS
jgi:ribonuclease J